MTPTPTAYRFQDRHRYPIDNVTDFEFWLTQHPPEVDGWTYLPITWTAYYKMCKYGADKTGMRFLQDYINRLPPARYFTVVQWDDGILHDLPTGTRVYAMGSPGDYQLPLICEPHQYQFGPTKDIFCSFVGRITHPIRNEVINQLSGKQNYYISTQPHNMRDFCEVLARSKFVIASRGYGATSFRICEGLQYGCSIVYHSDTFLAPHGLMNGSIKYVPGGGDLYKTINSFAGGYNYIQNIETYHQYFTYEANRKLIIEDLKKQQ